MQEDEFYTVLKNLDDVDSDNIGSVHSFLRELADSYPPDERDLDYLSERGLDGLENLSNVSGYLSSMKRERFSNFGFFDKRYSGFREEIERSVMERSTRLMYGEDTSLTKSDSCRIAASLMKMGLGEKLRPGRYRLTAEPEDYDMVNYVLEKI